MIKGQRLQSCVDDYTVGCGAANHACEDEQTTFKTCSRPRIDLRVVGIEEDVRTRLHLIEHARGDICFEGSGATPCQYGAINVAPSQVCHRLRYSRRNSCRRLKSLRVGAN